MPDPKPSNCLCYCHLLRRIATKGADDTVCDVCKAKKEALPHTMDPPKPLTVEELEDLYQRIEALRQRNIRELGESTLIALHDCEWLSLKALIDHLTRRAEEAEKLVEGYKAYAASMEPWKIWAVDELTKRGYEWKSFGA